jgi:hypothetical protein
LLELGLAAASGDDGLPAGAQRKEGWTGNPSQASPGHGQWRGDRVAAWRPGNGGEEGAVEVLGAGGAWARREEKKSGERCGREWRDSPIV